ncbi:hypothetical protein [Agrobacterium tumefaciens]|uniref:hypothetical protein n=1 Tax=Agrobacterium tumefaciens TaxID=358 RepID=UPI000FAF2C25|nr:hypothetical protein [Agrobacterium tumefaciens]MCP2132968.1 hypothetical protein [Rhizobium sp. SLBN-94]
MTENEETTFKASGAGRKLVGFAIITLIWLAVAFYLGWTAHGVPPENKCDGTYSCLTANEWGDFLAGVFAPVAFFWLLAAVWIQSDELKVTREVMRDQAAEAKKQAEYIGTQTTILKQGQADAQFRELLSMFAFWARREFARKVSDFDEIEQEMVKKDVGFLTESTPLDPVEFYIEVSTRLKDAALDKRDNGGRGKWQQFIDTTGPKRVQIVKHLRSISKFENEVSPAMLRVIESTNPDILANKLEGAFSQK